jgi:hypothetical protein
MLVSLCFEALPWQIYPSIQILTCIYWKDIEATSFLRSMFSHYLGHFVLDLNCLPNSIH